MRNKRGFTLIEIVVAIAAIGIMLAAGASGRKRMIESALAKQTAREMTAIRDAGVAYYWKNGAFPTLLSQLSGYMSEKLLSSNNPYGFSYSISSSGFRFQVSTTVPNTVGGSLGLEQFSRIVGATQDTITTSGVVNVGDIGGIIYEKDKGWSS